jgi:hypothetical protein
MYLYIVEMYNAGNTLGRINLYYMSSLKHTYHYLIL